MTASLSTVHPNVMAAEEDVTMLWQEDRLITPLAVITDIGDARA